MLLRWGATGVSMLQGDITEQDVDAIVNAANPSLMGGGGVDGAIHRRGGGTILEECRTIRRENWPDGLPSGKAVITAGGLLRARYVIHTVGPIWKGGGSGEAEVLADCYTNSLQIAKGKRLRSIAFPAISTGVYGYPVYEAATIAMRIVKGFVEREEWPHSVNFVLFNLPTLQAYEKAAAELRPV
jgi:O-acetyl-ADP-ribose deacetylase (regulator of RNase III)